MIQSGVDPNEYQKVLALNATTMDVSMISPSSANTQTVISNNADGLRSTMEGLRSTSTPQIAMMDSNDVDKANETYRGPR